MGESSFLIFANQLLRNSVAIQKGPLLNPHHMGKQGNLSQLGGDFVLGPGMFPAVLSVVRTLIVFA